ncbi:hypothetical protein B0H17DRAFT_1330927 [Mycena rosella]|uniref:Uncharacterized protein n=1 Tax=Mycena rosella TaxID=1033263 RepID=A0AAD7DHJ9_MYCRO|nr:hypothetical protein B0H17DRAFT_1330927 [Mycena rosella]
MLMGTRAGSPYRIHRYRPVQESPTDICVHKINLTLFGPWHHAQSQRSTLGTIGGHCIALAGSLVSSLKQNLALRAGPVGMPHLRIVVLTQRAIITRLIMKTHTPPCNPDIPRRPPTRALIYRLADAPCSAHARLLRDAHALRMPDYVPPALWE